MTRHNIAILPFVLAFLATQATADQIWTIEELSVAVVYLHRSETARVLVGGVWKEVWLKGPGDTGPLPNLVTHSGTGFLVTDGQRLYLVTASHVAKEAGPGTLVTLAGHNDTPETMSLDVLSGVAKQTWVHHPSADVAILVLKPSPQTLERYLQNRFLPAGVLSAADASPSRETQLTVIGFPEGLGVERRFSPLTLQTLPASGILSLKRFDAPIEADFFLLQNPSTGGYSGAPVIDVSRYVMGAMTTTGRGTRVYGLVHGTISDETGGKLAAVVPARFIVETLRLAATQ